jgi:hypothetical protein
MKARNVRLCKKVVALAMATSFTVVGTAAKVSGDEVRFSPDLVRGHYYDEDVKQNMRELDFIISGGEVSREKVYNKQNNMRLNYR